MGQDYYSTAPPAAPGERQARLWRIVPGMAIDAPPVFLYSSKKTLETRTTYGTFAIFRRSKPCWPGTGSASPNPWGRIFSSRTGCPGTSPRPPGPLPGPECWRWGPASAPSPASWPGGRTRWPRGAGPVPAAHSGGDPLRLPQRQSDLRGYLKDGRPRPGGGGVFRPHPPWPAPTCPITSPHRPSPPLVRPGASPPSP